MRSSTAEGGEIVGEEYFPLDHIDYERVVDDIMATGADVVFNTIVPPGLTPFLEQLHDAGFTARGGQIVCTYFDENFLNLVPAEHVEGLYGCLDYYRDVDDPFSIELLNRYEALYPGSAMFTAGSACTGTYRALKLWEAAVNEAGSLNQDDVIAALDHARIAQGPGGPAEMVPGQHHVRMNMYIARSRGRHVQGGEEPRATSTRRSARSDGPDSDHRSAPPTCAGGGAGSDHRAGAALALQEVSDVRKRLRVLVHEEVTALVAAKLRVRDPADDGFAVRPGRHAVVHAARDERGRRDASQPRPHVVAAASDDLQPLASLLLLGLRCGEARPQDVDDRPVTWVLGEPLVVEAHVEMARPHLDLLLGRPGGELVQRVRRPTLSPGRGAAQHQAIDALGPSDGELLGDHPAEADPEHVRLLPTNVVEQGGGVAGEVRHRRLALRHGGAAEAALVVDDHLEVAGEHIDQGRGRLDRGRRAVDEQQPWPLATALPIEVDVTEAQRRHGLEPRAPTLAPPRCQDSAARGQGRWSGQGRPACGTSTSCVSTMPSEAPWLS